MPTPDDANFAALAVRNRWMTQAAIDECFALQQQVESLGIKHALPDIAIQKGHLKPQQVHAILAALGKGVRGKIEGYEILEKLGEGGVGAVYKARQTFMNRTVAIKVLLPSQSHSQENRDRFLREAHLLASLNHPNVIQAIDAGESEGMMYVVMEFIQGESLRARLRREGKLAPAPALAVVTQVAEALAHAHAHGLVHRDVKPENILIGADGVVKLADLGLSKSMSETELALTQAGVVMGTPLYIAPEQIDDSRSVDIRSDLYSLGVVLYEMLTGTNPFLADSIAAIVARHLAGKWPSLREQGCEVPPALEAIQARLMHVDRTRRYATPLDLLQNLERLEKGLPVAAPARLAREVRKHSTRIVARIGGAGAAASAAPAPPPGAAATPGAAAAAGGAGVFPGAAAGRRPRWPLAAALAGAPLLGLLLWLALGRDRAHPSIPGPGPEAPSALVPTITPVAPTPNATPSSNRPTPTPTPTPTADPLAPMRTAAADPARAEEALRLLAEARAAGLPPEAQAEAKREEERLTRVLQMRRDIRTAELNSAVTAALARGEPRPALDLVEGAAREFAAPEWSRTCDGLRDRIKADAARRLADLTAALRQADGGPAAARARAAAALRTFLAAAQGIAAPDAATLALLEKKPAAPTGTGGGTPAGAADGRPPALRLSEATRDFLSTRQYQRFLDVTEPLVAAGGEAAFVQKVTKLRAQVQEAQAYLVQAERMVREQALKSPIFLGGKVCPVNLVDGVPRARTEAGTPVVDALSLPAPELARLWADHGDAPAGAIDLLAGLDCADDLTEWLHDYWTAGSVDGRHAVTVTPDTAQRAYGRQSIHVHATGGLETFAAFPSTRAAGWDLAKSQQLLVSIRGVNTTPTGWQMNGPVIILRNQQGGCVRYAPATNLLPKNGAWVDVALPLRAPKDWTVEEVVPLRNDRVDWIEFHFDTWETGFDVWIDGLRFDPPPPSLRLPSLYLPDLAVREVRVEPAFPRLECTLVEGEPQFKGKPSATRAPRAGVRARFVAVVANLGLLPSPPTRLTWLGPDGKETEETAVPALAPGKTVEVAQALAWPADALKERAVVLDAANTVAETCKTNNTLAFAPAGRSVHVVLDAATVQKYDGTRSYLGSAGLGEHVRSQLEMLNAALGQIEVPGAGRGVPVRLRLDQVTEADLAAGRPEDPNADVVLYVDAPLADRLLDYPGYPCMWVLRALVTETPNSVGPGLMPLSLWNVAAEGNEVNGVKFDATAGRADLVDPPDGWNLPLAAWLNPYHALACAATAGQRGGWRGDHFFALPDRVTLAVTDKAGHPLDGATLTFYQSARGKIDKTPEFTARTEKDGLCTLPKRDARGFRTETGIIFGPNPFGKLNLKDANGVFVVRVQKGAATFDRFLDVTAMNAEWLRGNRKQAVLPFPTGIECTHK